MNNISVGTLIGRWRTITSQRIDGRMYWHCACSCGSAGTLRESSLLRGDTTSCGCYRAETSSKLHRTHGMRHLPEYHVWESMKRRCNAPNSTHYADYGGRGIKVCPRWNGFIEFYADMGSRPSPKHTIDRIDNNGNYEPGNCKWSTFKENQNNRRSSRFVTARGKTKTIKQWSEETGVNYSTLSWRINRGWETERAFKI